MLKLILGLAIVLLSLVAFFFFIVPMLILFALISIPFLWFARRKFIKMSVHHSHVHSHQRPTNDDASHWIEDHNIITIEEDDIVIVDSENGRHSDEI